MILVDTGDGSKDLFPRIRELTPNVVLTRIYPQFGDIAWDGNNEDGPIRVGVEYKTIDDVLDCVSSHRFGGHQAIGMTQNFARRYLLVEGRIRMDRSSGIIQKWNWHRKEWVNIVKAGREFLYRDLEHWYTTVEEQANFRVVKTVDEHESARWVFAKYTWWTMQWAEHTAMKQFYVAPPPYAYIQEPSFIRKVAKEFYKIGWEKSIEVEKAFKSVRDMVNANEQAWRQIPGIGATIAQKIIAQLKGDKVD